MKLGLKEKIQKIIDSYKENVKTQQDAIVAVLEPFKVPSYVDRFTADGLKATIKEPMDEILSNWKKWLHLQRMMCSRNLDWMIPTNLLIMLSKLPMQGHSCRMNLMK